MPLKNARICNATSKRTGKQCGDVAMVGKEKCRTHGGKSLSGMASATFKDGNRSKYMYLPEHLSTRVGEYLKDDKLIELREQIAVTDTRITEMYERLHPNAPIEINDEVWEKITNLFEQRRRLVESESKRLKDSQQIITSEQFLTFIQFVLSVIKENVTDRDQLNRISAKLISTGLEKPR